MTASLLRGELALQRFRRRRFRQPNAGRSEYRGGRGVRSLTQWSQQARRAKRGLIGWLAVRLGKERMPAVIAAVVDWVTDRANGLEITYGGDTLRISGATPPSRSRSSMTSLTVTHLA